MSSPEPPPYTITPAILSLVAEIAGEVGRIGALSGEGNMPKLRRENRIRSVHASEHHRESHYGAKAVELEKKFLVKLRAL